MFVFTLIAWAGALLVAKLLRITIIKGRTTPFVMELPPYHIPTFKGLAIHTWERTWQYIKKAGTVILAISIIFWAMMTLPGLPESKIDGFAQERKDTLAAFPSSILRELQNADKDTELSAEAQNLKTRLNNIDAKEARASLKNSLAGRIGTTLENTTRWAGFDWRTNIALIGGFAAKKVVVSTLGTAYSLGKIDSEERGSLSAALSNSPNWSPLVALSLIIFAIFYSPCLVAVVCIARESGSWKWGAFSMTFNTLLAFLLATVIFQIGSSPGY